MYDWKKLSKPEKIAVPIILFIIILCYLVVEEHLTQGEAVTIAIFFSVAVLTLIIFLKFKGRKKVIRCECCGEEKERRYFVSDGFCKKCATKSKAESEQILLEVQKTGTLDEKHIIKMKNIPKKLQKKFFDEVFQIFESDGELDERELNILEKMQKVFNFTDSEIEYEDKIKPYLYANYIKEKGELPTPKWDIDGVTFIPQKKEVVHHLSESVLKERKMVRVGYSGGSRGVSIRIMKGVSYRVGAHRGHVIKEEQMVTTSHGVLIVTNKRLFLQPTPGNKPVNIPIKQIASFSCYENGLEVYKTNREKGFFFTMASKGAVEIFSICLGFLMGEIE
jgi:hypothetical protein